MSKKKSVLLIIIALVLGIGIGVGATLGLSYGMGSGTAVDISAQRDALVEEMEQKLTEIETRISDTTDQMTALKKLSSEVKKLYSGAENEYVIKDEDEIKDLIDRCKDAGVDASSLIREEKSNNEVFVYVEDAENIYDTIKAEYHQARNTITNLNEEKSRLANDYMERILDLTNSVIDQKISDASDK